MTGTVYAADPIGGIIEQSGVQGSIVRLDGEEIDAKIKEQIVSYDEIETTNGRLKIEFIDQTQVSLTEHTYMEIDEYVYDPDPSKSRMAMNFVQGTARFATGGLGLVPKENIVIQTPTATIGVRGTDFTTTVDELGRSLVILLPDADCDDYTKLELGCKPSGSITVTNLGGTVLLEEAYQAVMVSTLETQPTQPVTLIDLDLNQIDNMFIVSKPTEIVEAEEQQAEDLKGDGGLLDFKGLDIDFLEQDSLAETTEDLEFTELDMDLLDVDFLEDLLDIVKTEVDGLAEQSQSGTDRIQGTRIGLDPTTQINTFDNFDGKIYMTKQVANRQDIKLDSGSNARIVLEDGKLIELCINQCTEIQIEIIQQ
jgi:hypothetical protein|tara:strand:+ start:9043 stop:10143 length:1101 start_codon:yes stop_codon:yes gene_type:complete